MPIRVLASWDIPEIGIQMLREAGMEVTVWKGDQPLSQSSLSDRCKLHNALLSQSTDKLDAQFLSENKHLDIIGQFSVGCDNIDLKAAKENNIVFGNAPGAMTHATADIAFGLMIAASRNFFQMHKKIQDGQWTVPKPQDNLGFELRGKTLGIFGLGKIGFEMARLCHSAYHMPIIYCNRSPNYVAEHILDARMVTFEELLIESDVISVHASLNDSTRNLFDWSVFEKMKSTSLFINTARGGIHDEEDLIDALQKGIIKGAGLDVTNPEPMAADNPLLSLPNVTVLPHIGSATIEARNNMSRMAAENIIGYYLYGKAPYQVK